MTHKMNYFKDVFQMIFYVWIIICTSLMFLSALKNLLNQPTCCKTTVPISVDVDKSLSKVSHSQIELEESVKQLNESIHSAKRSEKVIEPILTETKKGKQLAINSRCQHQDQSYLPGDLLKLEKGWMRCTKESGKVTWVEVK